MFPQTATTKFKNNIPINFVTKKVVNYTLYSLEGTLACNIHEVPSWPASKLVLVPCSTPADGPN